MSFGHMSLPTLPCRPSLICLPFPAFLREIAPIAKNQLSSAHVDVLSTELGSVPWSLAIKTRLIIRPPGSMLIGGRRESDTKVLYFLESHHYFRFTGVTEFGSLPL